MRYTPTIGTVLAASLIALAACQNSAQNSASPSRPSAASQAAVPGSAALLSDDSGGDDWAGYGRTYGEQHFSPLTDINDGNVGRLGLAWSMDLGPGNPATIPVAVGGVLYFSSGLSVVRAVHATNGRLIWEYDSRVAEHDPDKVRPAWGIRGIGYWNGKVYTGTQDGRLIALDARTGAVVWSVQTTQQGDGRFITGAPRLFDGKVVIGHGGADSSNVRGYVTAYDAETGKQLWRFFLVPGNPADGFEDATQAMAAKTWSGEWWKYGGGGTAWNAFTYDAETDTLLIGTGNGAPWNQKIRSPGGGDNLFLCSIVALDAKTGKYKWHYQINPGDTWDYNAAMDIHLADLVIHGQRRKVAIQAPKNGFLYVIDRTNGKLISAGKIARVTWAERIDLKTGRPVEVASARFRDGKNFELWPSYTGAHSWMPSAFSPQTGLAYIPRIDTGAIYDDKGIDLAHWSRPSRNAPGLGLNIDPGLKDPRQSTTALIAWNPATQQKAWEVPTIGGWNGGIMATGGNLVFQGQLNGRFSAYAADTGRELWHFDGQAGIIAAPITYRASGRQYLTVFVGMGTSAAADPRTHGGILFDNRTQQRRVLTFMLDGGAKLPPAPPPFTLTPIADPGYRPDKALASTGKGVYAVRCLTCHGFDAKAGGLAPDLRVSAIPQSAEAFDAIVRGGALIDNNMPRFEELTDKEMLALRHYLRSRADDLRHGKP